MENSNEENERNNIDKNWFRKHSETITVIITIIGGFLWFDSKMDAKFDKVDAKFDKFNERLTVVERDVSVIKTILSLKGIPCNELAKKEDAEKK